MGRRKGTGSRPGFWQDNEQDRSADASSGTGWGILGGGVLYEYWGGVRAGSRGSWDPHPLKGEARDCLAGDLEEEEAGLSLEHTTENP